MIDLVAKRYVKALMIQRGNDSLTSIYDELNSISTAFNSDKFLLIVESTEVRIEQKIELILSFIDSCSLTTTNLIRLLGDNKRLNIIPSIVSDLKNELASLNNSYDGIVYTNNKLSDSDMERLNTQFSEKFNVTLSLTQNVCDYDGVKVDIDGLGCEVAFSKSRLRNQMINHIIKAI